MDDKRLEEFLGKFVMDLGATVAAGSVVLGDRLGLYRALAEGPQLPAELAGATGLAERYVEEWLRGQAASGYVEYDAATGRFQMNEEQVFAFTDPDGPVYLPGAFQLALGTLRGVPRLVDAFRTGAGVGWHEQDEDVFLGCERFFRPGYSANLVSSWLPALDGVEKKLAAGGRVADVGCGLGASTVLMASAYRNATFVGADYHDRSIQLARKRAAEAGVADRVSFEAAGAADLGGGPFDLVTTFDCLHDMGDPVGAARNLRHVMDQDGTWMIVEPAASDSVAENLNPLGRVYYSFSTLLCVPNAVSQGALLTLGAQAGEEAIRRVVTEAGFTRFRRAAATPFNLVYDVRP